MTRQELLRKCHELLARFASEVKIANAMGLFDINKIAEDFLVPILAITFDCPKLKNQNRIQTNFPAVDLGCEASRLSIQITADSSSSKIRETLEKFEAHNLSADFDSLYVYVITERQNSYNSLKLTDAVNKASIKFEPSKHILDLHGLAKRISELDNEKLEHIARHLEKEFKRADASLQFRNDLDAFLSVSQKKIDDEKKTRKYIPSIFVETSETKEEVRYFANPMFFYRKIDEDLRRIDFVHFNALLDMAKISPLTDNLRAITTLEAPSGLVALEERLAQQASALKAALTHVSPFSYYGERTERFSPSDYLTGYWTVFRHSIESSGSGVYRSLEKISKKIEISRAKIFLVTGMAGQGKTNFVCDLIENQFRSFEVPTIFIPGRILNDHPSPNRILSYITNNRFAPDVRNLHELLKLLNDVATECQKPFVIAIDGINEVSDLTGFGAELAVFLEAMSQYDFVRVIITCRNEFFEQKFADVFEPQFTNYIYRVNNLRSEMSEHNKTQLLDAYLRHFRIEARLSKAATAFLENDLILLRIFSEIHEGKNVGYVSDIYKGEIFEGYLTMKIKQFPAPSRQQAMNSLYNICSRMFANGEFSQISLEGFNDSERLIIERLIGEDIILRREVPSNGLTSLGIENISFTYDELRDFILAHYCVAKLAGSQSTQLSEIFKNVSAWPIYEGFIRYAYVIARKQKSKEVIDACEASKDFSKHYLNNLSLLSADIQTPEDARRVVAFLNDSNLPNHDLCKVAWFLFRKRDTSQHLNIQLLLNHVGTLDDEAAERFMGSMFSSLDFHSRDWQDKVSNLLSSFQSLKVAQKLDLGIPALAFVLHFLPYGRWEQREEILNFFTEFRHTREIRDAVDACKIAASTRVQSCLKEIASERMKA